ncbi:hypothetical protein Rumeso_03536 [Rubellimicrobium mesophilum DSM 19309]|uniref:Guanylate cyclase domain-containing protein n=1 Tax=Rubellimicrobium mesophilum DSM 19309 TaxID=442562 RepID=A0A017HKN8_9RHOB|nr:adenylate/guanylate cyclase domain-containing protein [Rubellimicrobium mesophilum]EYD74895.1 hypothetical protein Rumeso_03536 [Rubellimicrobium mesophilum DSM 19309]
MTGMRCSVCGGAIDPGARFCPSCGTRLVGQAPARSRFMSVLFCDLVESTALNERIGDEAMFALLAAYQDICQSVVDEEGGYVAKFMGDGMLAYFGYPVAMKNSASNAVSAALGIIERVRRLSGPGGAALQVCAGVATGWVVVGDAHASPAARETMAIGGTVNLAARLLAATRPGTVAVGDEVCRKLDPAAFTRSFLGIHPLKGFSNPIAVWAVARAQASPSRGEFIGRTGALGRLMATWDEASRGRLRAVEVQAPGGFGKTTLVRHFLAQAATDQEVYEIRGLSHRRDQSFGCLKPVVAELAGLDTAAPPEAQRVHLAEFAPGATGEGLALLLGLDPTPVAPLIRQERIRRALTDLFGSLVGAGRAVLFVDDAHWIDPDTQALLDGMPSGNFADHPLLLLATRRPEGEHLWAGTAEVIDLELFPDSEATAMVDALDREERLSPETREGIVRRAAGVPLYLEHITRAVLERPSTEALGALPDTMVEALLERFDRLEEGQSLVEAAAVLGPAVRVDVLARMLGQGQHEVADQVADLVSRGLFGQDSDGTIAFDHALIRDAVLETLLSSQRVDLHSRALAAYAAVAPERLEAEPATEAYHLLGAARPARAIPRLIEAARRAIAVGNLTEAMAHLRRSEAALADVPPGRGRDDLEMLTEFFIGDALVQTRGFADGAVRAAYQRSLELCLASAGGSETEFQIVWGIWAHMLVVGETATAARMAQRMDEIARDLPELRVLAESARSVNAFSVGDFAVQEEAWTRTSALYDLGKHRFQAVTYLMDGLELALLFRIHGRWIAGDEPGWRAAMAEAAAHERRLALPFLGPYIRVFGAGAHCYAMPESDIRPDLQAATALASELGQPFWMMAGNLWLTAARAQMEGPVATLADQEAAVGLAEAMGLRLTISFHEALLARSHATVGRHEDAETLVGRALAAIAEGQDRVYEPEVLRQKAEIGLLARPDDLEAAHATLTRAADLARGSGARAWSALIAGSQARLLARGEGREAAEDWLRRQLEGLVRPGSENHPAFRSAAQALDRPV